MNCLIRFLLPVHGILLVAVMPLFADQAVDFNRDIRPLLSANCLICHGPDEEERAAGLRLDTQDGSREDLGGYSAITPGDPDSSELLLRLVTDDEDIAMPPEGKGRRFTQEEVDLIRQWIKQGGDYAKHWSYEKPVRPKLPVVEEVWVRNPIDHFIYARLKANGLKPSPEADRFTLARRVAMDLTGLPPTWEEASAFANDKRENAYEHFVDQQLAKPSFGERWARVWLDLARYADSAGYADDPARTIWAFRDYVIRSLNENKPFDQFTIEQIAGDLLENPTTEQLIATAFHRNTQTNSEGGTNDEEFRNAAVVDRVNTTMAVWMGTTMACAQCHTHKYDPITHDEYFQFFAFFNSTEDTDKKNESPTIEIWTDEQETRKLELADRIAELKEEISRPNEEIDAAQEIWWATEQDEPQWLSLVASETASRYRELMSDKEGWVTVSGEKVARDNYSLQFATTTSTVSALKLEVPPEQKDNFVLTQVKATWEPSEKQSVEARYVRIDLPGDKKMIHLTELQAFSGDVNVATEGTAKQSSTGFGGEAKFVNDGNTSDEFSHTAVEKDPWLEIDLGSVVPIDNVVIWNRMDGGDAIIQRLKGFRLSLLAEDRSVLWQKSPAKVPQPSETYGPDGSLQIGFAVAIADHHQKGFPATAVLNNNRKTGWAIGPKLGKAHELTLIAKQPVELGDGTLTIELHQNSDHVKHLLDRFRLRVTDSENVTHWAKMPREIQELVRSGAVATNSKQKSALAAYYRSITPLLAPQREELQKSESELASMKPSTTVPVMRQLPAEKRRVTNVQIRGNYQSKGNQVEEGTPSVFHPLPQGRPKDRLALAHWLVDPENPLTARVIANRHWEQVFGTGIVDTSEEFGSQGELPSHPMLLDWLAMELQESGWNLKHLLKLLVTSATYRQHSVTSEELQQSDPFNRLYARGPRFRVSAEMVRDQTLFVSGLLTDKMFGNPVNPPQPELGLKAAFGAATDWTTSAGDDRYRRGIYTTWRRSSPYPSMAQFDAPNRDVCTVRRIRTNTPLQALVTLNDPVYVEAAQSLARKVILSAESTRARTEFAFQICLQREPTDNEVERLTRLVDETYKRFISQPVEAKKMATEPLGELPEGADVAEHAAWTVVANVILNLDEMFMKR